MNLWGVARLDDFDPALCRGEKVRERSSDAKSVIVIGAGGSKSWRHMRESTGAPCAPGEFARRFDAWSRSLLEGEAARLREAGYDVQTIFPFDEKPVCFAQMAEAAGLLVASPVVGLLLHPEYGPWLSLRGAFVVSEALDPGGELDFDPCSACSAPCLEACPVGTYPEPGRAEVERCAGQRHRGGCADDCAVRRACPCGAEHRFDAEHEAAVQSAPLGAMRRAFGLGWWGLVPAFLRRRRAGS